MRNSAPEREKKFLLSVQIQFWANWKSLWNENFIQNETPDYYLKLKSKCYNSLKTFLVSIEQVIKEIKDELFETSTNLCMKFE